MKRNIQDTIPTSRTKIKFDFAGMKWTGITVSQVKLWERLYPDIDVDYQLQFEMIRWLDKKKGTKITLKRNWKRFITNWLNKEQEKAVLS